MQGCWPALGLVTCTLAACGGMSCPISTSSHRVSIRGGSAQVCSAGSAEAAQGKSQTPVPSEAPGARGHLVPEPPPASSESWEGPARIYDENGTLRATGRYVPGPKSARPSGRWTFFYSNGSPRSAGDYLNGVPQGCFASWDEAGGRRTLRYSETAGRFEDEVCEAPTISDAEDALPAPPPEPRVDIQLGTLALSSGFGVRSGFLVTDPEQATNLELALHTRIGPLRLGGAAAYRQSKDGDHRGLMGAGSISLQVLQAHERFGIQIGTLFGYRQYDLLLRPPEDSSSSSTVSVNDWNVFGAAELNTVTKLWKGLFLVAGLRGEVGIPSTTLAPLDMICVDSSTTDCNILGQKRVRTGTPELALNLGLRYEF